MSYDEVDALADFARAHDIPFPLLADPDSEVIERFGILNTLIDPDDHPWYGIPFPGAYVLDRDGTIVAKYFESSLFLRPSADELLRAALGEDVVLAPIETPTDGEVAVDVSLAGELWRAGVMHDLVVRLAVPEGQHLYGEPVPDGMVATSVEVDAQPGLIVKPAVVPHTSPLTLAGTGETLHVFEGDVVVRVPMTQLSRTVEERGAGSGVQRITGTVRWQACDDDVCFLPRSERFEVEVAATRHLTPNAEFADPNGMDVATHFAAMISRRTDRSPGEIMAAVTDPD